MVAGKWWGNTNEQPVLALHGWQDNAGTYDRLLELLPGSTPVLALDLPGHGFSSHYHDGMLYHFSSFLIVIRRVLNYYNWRRKLTIIGHSGGGVIAFVFASMYSELVNTLITLDAVKPITLKDPHSIPKLGRRIDTIIAKSKRKLGDNPKYSLDEIHNRWLESTKGSLTVEDVEILSKRGVQLDLESGQYYLTRDPKLKLNVLQHFDEYQYLEMANSIKSNFLAIKFNDSRFVKESLTNSQMFVKAVSQTATSFKLVSVEGDHHAHLTNPKVVASALSQYI